MADTPDTTTTEAPPPPTGAPPTGAPAAPDIALAERVISLEKQIAEWAPIVSAHDSLQTRYEQAQAEWAQQAQVWATEKTLLIHGVSDPEAMDVVQLFYARVQAADGQEKPTLSEWLQSTATLPKAVLAYMPKVAAPTTAPPDPNRGAGAAPAPGGATYSASALATMDPTSYRSHRDAVLASLGKR